MDEKSSDTKNGSNYSDSSERKDEDIGDTLSSNSSEPSLDKKCICESSVGEDCSINHENSNTPSDEIGEKFCTASHAEMDKSNGIEANKKSSLESENLISTRSRAFTEHREQSSYSADNSASGSSTANVSEGLSPPRSFENKLFSSELENDTNIASCSYAKNTTNLYGDTQSSCSTQQIGKNSYTSDALCRYFDSIKNEVLSEDGDKGTSNPVEDVSGITSSLNNINVMQESESNRLSFIDNKSSNESDINDKSKTIFKNDDLMLTDMKEVEPCPKLSPIEDESGKDKSLNNISDVMTCFELPSNNENTRKNDSSLKNRGKSNPTPDLTSMNKENHLNESDVSQYKTFPARERESKILKLSSPAESPTRTLRNIDINLAKRPPTPGDNLSPESHDMMKEVKKRRMNS